MYTYICNPPKPTFCVADTVCSCTASGKYLQIARQDELLKTRQQLQAKGTSLPVAKVKCKLDRLFFHVSIPNFNPHKVEINKWR